MRLTFKFHKVYWSECFSRFIVNMTFSLHVVFFHCVIHISVYFTVDETRVTLDEIAGEEGSDYINANFVQVKLYVLWYIKA